MLCFSDNIAISYFISLLVPDNRQKPAVTEQ